jgi:2'-5' RNA ligase
MESCNGAGTRINSFALVSYLPEPLAGYLDRLRSDLVKDCKAKSHLTFLPPRPLLCPPEQASQEVSQILLDFQPFRVELGSIEVFPVTRVIYLSILAGSYELAQLHTRLNSGCLAFREPYAFHPHVTLAQELDMGSVAEAAEVAAQRWREFTGSREFVVERLTFVQNTLENRWADLKDCSLLPRMTLESR